MSVAVAAVFRVERRFGAASDDASDDAASPVAAFRVVRRFGAASALAVASGAAASSPVTTASAEAFVVAVRVVRRLAVVPAALGAGFAVDVRVVRRFGADVAAGAPSDGVVVDRSSATTSGLVAGSTSLGRVDGR